MTKPLTQKQLAAQQAAAMTKEEAERVAAGLLPKAYASDLERLGALFLACMRAGVNLYPNEEGWDGGRGVHFDAVGALVVDEKTDSPASFYVEKVPGAPLTDALELVMLRALAFVALSGGEPPKEAVSADVRAQGATEFMRVTERLLSLIEESPEVLARVESAMRQTEGAMAEELRAAVVDRDFLNRRYTL